MFLFAVVLFFIGQPCDSFAQEKTFTIVLDAGHGGKDPGNIGNGYREKNIVLKVVKEIGKELDKIKGIKVIYTRKKDVKIDLWKRGEIANKAKADLFVSVHCDAHTSNAFGAGTFVLGLKGNRANLEIAKRENAVILKEANYKKKYQGFDSNSAGSVIGLSLLQEENLDKSLVIASLIQNNFASKLKRKDRKVKQDNFQVLRETIMPSVLVELGFLTNKKEGRYLNSKKGQQEMAKAIAKAIEKYVNQLQLNTIDAVTDDVVIVDEEPVVIEEVVKEEEKKEAFFKIQIASSRKKIATKSYNFKGLRNVERVKVGRYYKYYYGNTSNYKEVKVSLQKAKRKGYSSAFIAAFKNGEKISLKEALN
ncbi:MAG: N-acetylmuramoyl-L-alanine amidase [Flavobacteriaceae bacterium]